MTTLASQLFIAMIPIDHKITNFYLHLYIYIYIELWCYLSCIITSYKLCKCWRSACVWRNYPMMGISTQQAFNSKVLMHLDWWITKLHARFRCLNAYPTILLSKRYPVVSFHCFSHHFSSSSPYFNTAKLQVCCCPCCQVDHLAGPFRAVQHGILSRLLV